MKNKIRHQLKEKAKNHIDMMGVLSVNNYRALYSYY